MASNYGVCLCNDSFPPVIDGVANAVVNYARIITEKYTRAVVATPEYPDVEDKYPFTVVRYPSFDTTAAFGYRTGNPFAPRQLLELSELNYQIVHSHCPIVSTLLARALREQKGVPVVFTYHTKFDVDVANAVRSGFLQSVAIKSIVENISACDEVWVVSDGAGENLRKLGYEGDYRVMHNGVDLPRGQVSREESDAIGAEYGISPDETVFLFMGRMMWYKGLRFLLDGVARARSAGANFRMVFVGGGGDYEEVKSASDELGLGDCCVFTGVESDRERVRRWFCRADMFLFPSTFDTNGLVVREAAACSLASALIRGSCAAEGVTDGVNGVLIDETAEAIAKLIERVCREGLERYRTIGENASRDLYISWESAVSSAYSEYGRVIDEFNRGSRKPEKPFAEVAYKTVSQIVDGMERYRNARLAKLQRRVERQIRAYEKESQRSET